MSKATCTIEGCDRLARARTWCKRHYRWWELRGDPTAPPVRTYADRNECLKRDARGHKRCRRCVSWLPTDAFYRNRQTADRLAPECRACARLKDVERKYGLTEYQFKQALAAQDHSCLLCRTRFDEFARRPHVDHDHACCPGERSCGKCIRGVLCSNCNTGLGLFKDDPALLRSALAYLVRT